MRYCTYVGIDTHSQKHCICAITPETGSFIEHTIIGDSDDVANWIINSVESGMLDSPIKCVYEAGPTGFSLYRAITDRRIECVVAAPSKLPRRTDRIKNDRTDARWLAQMLIAGSVRSVSVPSTSQQALLELSGLRVSAVKDLTRAKQRVGSFMLKNSIVYTKTRRKYCRTFYRWASALTFEDDTRSYVFKELVAEVQRRQCNLENIDARIMTVIESDEHLDFLHRSLKTLPQVGDVLSFSMLAKVGDIHRFSDPNSFASYWGITPTEHSSGKSQIRGPMSKKGDDIVRSLLMEAATGYLKRISYIAHEDPKVPEPIRTEAAFF